MVSDLDADHTDRLDDHRVGQFRGAAPQRHLGRDHEVAEYVTSQSLVRGISNASATSQVDLGTGRARPEDGHKILGR